MEDTKTNKILVNVILDRSGSMMSSKAGTISGYNEYINQLRADTETEYQVSLIQFDAPHIGAELTVKYMDKPLAEVPQLGSKDYEPRGNTPLYDAIGECVRRVEQRDRGVIAVIITDGLENASTEFNLDAIKKLIKEKEAEGWKFAFLGCDIDSYAMGGSMGISAQSTANYARGLEDIAYKNMGESTRLYAMSARSEGIHGASMKAFFDNTQRKSQGDHVTVDPDAKGGRPAAPAPFQPQAGAVPCRDWSVKQA